MSKYTKEMVSKMREAQPLNLEKVLNEINNKKNL